MPEPTELLLHETFGDDGALSRTRLYRDAGALVLDHDGDEAQLDPGVVRSVFARYGSELDPSIDPSRSPDTLVLDASTRLVRLRHLARFDVIARDWLVLVEDGAIPRAELATAITAALLHLVRAAR